MEGFIKYASWGEDAIQAYLPQDSINIKTANVKTFGKVSNFPEKYASHLQHYITAMEKAKQKENKFSLIGNYDPEFHYYRVISVHGDIPNDNGDMFKWGNPKNSNDPELLRFESSLGRYVYQTFIGRGNFKNHKNDDVSYAVGINLDVVPNYNGKFIENLIAVDAQKDPELVRSIDKGYINAVSMGARVAYSICSCCGHIAHNEDEYCDHIKHNKGGQIYIEGKFVPVYEDNRGTNFIEVSWVTVPADRDALLLEKVASHMKEDAVDAVATLIYLYGERKTKEILNNLRKLY
jgi:hypothetical protein